ncbi:MAG: hypothetical protein O9340_12865 [Cyclobacteriaceae bacterium]|nr:hypothetical protein [Cyclobacteriaceae bacterium]
MRRLFSFLIISTLFINCNNQRKTSIAFGVEMVNDAPIRQLEILTFQQSIIVSKENDVNGRKPIFKELVILDQDQSIKRKNFSEGDNTYSIVYQYDKKNEFYKKYQYENNILIKQGKVILDEYGREKKHFNDSDSIWNFVLGIDYYNDSIVYKELIDGSLYSSTVKCLNDIGLPEKIIQSFFNNEGRKMESRVDTLIYLEFDERGNWIKRLKKSIMPTTERGKIQIRKIEYENH